MVPCDEDYLNTTFLNAALSTYPNRLPELLSDTISNSTARISFRWDHCVHLRTIHQSAPSLHLCRFEASRIRVLIWVVCITSPLQTEELIDSDLWAIRVENIWYLAYWSAKWLSLVTELESDSRDRRHSWSPWSMWLRSNAGLESGWNLNYFRVETVRKYNEHWVQGSSRGISVPKDSFDQATVISFIFSSSELPFPFWWNGLDSDTKRGHYTRLPNLRAVEVPKMDQDRDCFRHSVRRLCVEQASSWIVAHSSLKPWPPYAVDAGACNFWFRLRPH